MVAEIAVVSEAQGRAVPRGPKRSRRNANAGRRAGRRSTRDCATPVVATPASPPAVPVEAVPAIVDEAIDSKVAKATEKEEQPIVLQKQQSIPEPEPEITPDEQASVDEEPETEEPEVVVGPCDERTVQGLAAALERMVAMAVESPLRTSFHSVRPPPMTISMYLARVAKFFNCSAECFVLALIYIDRLIKRHPQLVVSPLTCHRLLATSMTLAAKFHDDVFYSNAFYAKVCGLGVKELGCLEEKLLRLLDYRLTVQASEFEMYRKILCKAAGSEQ